MKKTLILTALAALAFAMPAAAQKFSFSAFGGASRSYIPMIQREYNSILQDADGTTTTWYTTVTKEDYSNDFGAKAGVGIGYTLSPKVTALYEGGLQSVAFTRMLNREYYQTQDLGTEPTMVGLESLNSTAKLVYLTQTLGLGYEVLPKLRLEGGVQGNYVVYADQAGFSFWNEGGSNSSTTIKGKEGMNLLQFAGQAGVAYSPVDVLSLRLQYQRGITGMFTEDNQFGGNARYQGASLTVGYTF